MLPSQNNQDRDWLTRENAETDWDHGQRPEQRPLKHKLENGLVIIDKPSGPASNQISVWTRTILERGKTGHSGTLDPPATGVLPIGLDTGTKVLGPLTRADKEYVCRMELGKTVDEPRIRAVAEEFVGTLRQTPPEQSAVKREERDRIIYYLDVLEVDDQDVLFRIGCEKGFYVRTFCKQFGTALDTDGEMQELRRTTVGVFTENDAVPLPDLADAYQFWQNGEDHQLDEYVLPVEAGVRHLKKIVVKDSAVAALAHGANLGGGGIATLQDGIRDGELVALLTLKGELVAAAHATTTSEDMLTSDETVAELDRVFIDNTLYPKQW